WMSGPADAWTEFATDRRRQTAAQVFEPIAALQEPLPKSAGEVLFSLDKPLSWMSHPREAHAERAPLQQDIIFFRDQFDLAVGGRSGKIQHGSHIDGQRST